MYAFFLVFCCFFFFFKQKTAYEMRISDWSSDVCSSDLKKDIRDALTRLSEDLETRAAELSEVASGWRIQVRRDYAEWVARLYQEKPPRLSRALLETLALICYRQPVTRGEIEDVQIGRAHV